MKQGLQRFIRITLTRFVMKIFWLFPLKKKQIFLSSYEGKQYSCNPKAVYEKMREDERFKAFTFVWEINNPALRSQITDSRVRFVEHNSLKYFFNVLTSKYLLTNTGIVARIPVRKKQVNINTWHGGGAYKRVGYAINKSISGDLKELTIGSSQTTYFLSSSRIFTEVMEESIQLPKEQFLPVGMPRNDVFFEAEKSAMLRKKIVERYGLDENTLLLLYAPTYRGSVGEDTFAFDMSPLYALRAAVEKKHAKKAVLLVRMHYYSAGAGKSENAISASDYPDMQELLAAVDVLITDYSSSMWDFALSGKPCILYTPDLKDYDLDRGFYTPPSTWPGILCETEEEMLAAVENFDKADYAKRIEKYLEETGSYEDGKGAKQVLDLIKEGGQVCSKR